MLSSWWSLTICLERQFSSNSRCMARRVERERNRLLCRKITLIYRVPAVFPVVKLEKVKRAAWIYATLCFFRWTRCIWQRRRYNNHSRIARMRKAMHRMSECETKFALVPCWLVAHLSRKADQKLVVARFFAQNILWNVCFPAFHCLSRAMSVSAGEYSLRSQ